MSNLDELIELKKKELSALIEAKKEEALAEQARKDEEAKKAVKWPIKYTYYVHASKGEAAYDLFEESITILIHEDGCIETIKFNGKELKKND